MWKWSESSWEKAPKVPIRSWEIAPKASIRSWEKYPFVERHGYSINQTPELLTRE